MQLEVTVRLTSALWMLELQQIRVGFPSPELPIFLGDFDVDQAAVLDAGHGFRLQHFAQNGVFSGVLRFLLRGPSSP